MLEKHIKARTCQNQLFTISSFWIYGVEKDQIGMDRNSIVYIWKLIDQPRSDVLLPGNATTICYPATPRPPAIRQRHDHLLSGNTTTTCYPATPRPPTSRKCLQRPVTESSSTAAEAFPCHRNSGQYPKFNKNPSTFYCIIIASVIASYLWFSYITF